MKNKLKFKILAGFGLLIAMLTVAGAISIYEFYRLSKSLDAVIEDNYKTIVASKSMLEALEREDSGILMLMLGQWDEGRKIIGSADSAFTAAFSIAKNNITELNEDEYIEGIGKSYSEFKASWEKPIVGTNKEGNVQWYRDVIHQEFLDTKAAVNALMELNQSNMYSEATTIKDKSKRAMMPGIISLLSALIFSLLFNFFITKYLVSPLNELSKALREYNFQSTSLKVNIGSNDEIKNLEREINVLLSRMWSRLNPRTKPDEN